MVDKVIIGDAIMFNSAKSHIPAVLSTAPLLNPANIAVFIDLE